MPIPEASKQKIVINGTSDIVGISKKWWKWKIKRIHSFLHISSKGRAGRDVWGRCCRIK